MRLWRAAVAGVLVSLLAGAPALAAPALTIGMAGKQSNVGAIRPTVTVSGISGSFSGWLEFRRYGGTSCSGGYQSYNTVSVSGNNTYTGPDLQNGNPGAYGLWVRLRTSSIAYDTQCFPYLVQRNVTATATLARTTFDNNDRIEPQASLQNATSDAGGQVEFGRWAGSGCGSGTGTSAGILPVVNGKPQGTVNLQEGVLGQRSFRAIYSGDTKNSQSASACKDYTVGAHIRGKVFQDNDGNGAIDAGEEGIAGVVVTVRKGQTPVGTVTTNALGAYEILIFSTGTYSVSQTPPAGYDSTGPAELTVQITGISVDDRNFGVAQIPSTLLPLPTVFTGAPPDNAVQAAPAPAPDTGFGFIRIFALALVVIAVFVLLALLFNSRKSRDIL